MRNSPTIRKYAGSDSLAPTVSAARTAYPSAVERAKCGIACGAVTDSASTRPNARSVASTSTPKEREGNEPNHLVNASPRGVSVSMDFIINTSKT
jgi:hypothetical protein